MFKMRYFKFCNYLFALILAHLSTLGFTREVSHANVNTDPKWCTSQICEEAGKELIMGLDQSVDPCVDFYKHACGGWIKNHPISNADEYINQDTIFRKKYRTQLQEMLLNNETSDSETVRKVIDYFRSCMDLAAIEARGLSPLESIVSANGGWPLTLPSNSWNINDNNLTLQKIIENYAAVATPALFTCFSPHNISPILPKLAPSKTHLKQVYEDPFCPECYQKYDKRWYERYKTNREIVANEFARLRGLNVSEASIKDDISQIVEFETSLYDLPVSLNDRNFDSTIIEEQIKWNSAVSEFPDYAIDWLTVVRRTFDGTGIIINETQTIRVANNFMEKLANLLKKHSLRTIVNYVVWHVIYELAPLTSENMRKRFDSVNNSTHKDRPTYCFDSHPMVPGLLHVHDRTFLGKNTSQAASDMVSRIKVELEREVNLSTWMDDKMKSYASSIIRNTKHNIGYRPWYYESERIDELYRPFDVGADLFENVVNYRNYANLLAMKQVYRLTKPYPLTRLERTLSYYGPSLVMGSIEIAPVMFQLPYFHPELPMAMNYGNMGSTIGHEYVHTLDGIVRWPQDLKKCLVDQYNNYTVIENYKNNTIYIDGTRTLDVNLADYVGMVIALNAYKSYKKEHNLDDYRISQFNNITDIQLFYLRNGQWACESAGLEALMIRKDSVHSPRPARVNGVVSNMPEFAESFQCPPGSPMNPHDKCPKPWY